MIDLGWTRDEVLDQIDFPFMKDLWASWRRYPPLRILAASFVQYKPPEETKGRLSGASNLGPDFFAVAKKRGK